MRRRLAVVTALAVGLSLGVPPEVVPSNGGWPLSGLFAPLLQVPALAAVTGLPVQERAGDASDVDHYVSSGETTADGGAGKVPDRGAGVADPAPPASAETPAFTTPTKPGDETSFNELTSERRPDRSGATYDEFENEDGSITRQIHDGPINYKAADGTYQPIDTTLTARGDRIEAGANSIDLTLAATGSDESAPVSPEPSASPSAPAGDGQRVESADEALASLTTPAGQTFAYDLAGAADVTAVVDGSKATYQDILPGTDLELQATRNGLKETIVIDSPAAGNEWLFPMKLDGLTAREQADGSLDLLGADGAVALRVPAGWMQDSKIDPVSGAPAESAGVHYDLVTVDGGPALKVTADAAWLNDPARQYPVRIDPSVDYPETTTATNDVFVDNSEATTTHAGSDNLPVGTYDSGTTKARTFLHFGNFNTGDLKGVQVRSAKLVAYHTWSYNCASHLPVYVHRVTSAWTGTDIQSKGGYLWTGPTYTTPIASWTIANNYPACENTGNDRSKGAWRAVTLPIRTFNGWASGTMPNFGLALTASETDSTGWKRFTSRDYGDGSYAPYLSLTYDFNVDPQVNEQYPAYGASAQTLTPELVADANDPDNWPKTMKYRFIVYAKDGKTELRNSDWITKKSWTVPAGTLVWGENYYWSVQVDDSLANNIKYAVKHLLTTPVPQPAITSALSQNSGQGFDPAIGNYTTSARDAMVATVGPPLEVARSYNSIDPRTDQAFGAGWSSVLDAEVVEKKATVGGSTAVNTAVVTYPNGREVAFGRNADGSFYSPAGRASNLRFINSSGYELTEKDGTTYEFKQNSAAGRYTISAIRDVSGKAQTFTYTGGLITMVTAASGRTLDVAWTGSSPNRVASVATDPAVAGDQGTVNTWTYAYTSGKLTRVCPPTSSGECHTYEHNASTSAYQTAVANVRPYSYWRLNETSGAKAESSVLENGGADVGTYSNVTLGQPGPLAGSTATAAGFNGSSAHVQVPARLASDAGNQAISMWFKTTASAGPGVLYGQSLEADAAAGTTYQPYNPTLYVGSDGRLMGGFPKAPQLATSIGPLQSARHGQCITAPSTTDGVVIVMRACAGTTDQSFAWTSQRQLMFTIGGVTKCLDTEDHDITNGTDVVVGTCDSSQGNQKWDVQVDGQIVNDNSGACITLESVTPGGSTHIWTCDAKRYTTQLFPSRVRNPMSSTATVADGNWHHVVLSASGNRQELYVDGQQVDFETGVTVQDMSPYNSYLGRGFLGGGWPNQAIGNTISNQGWLDRFTGSIAEVAYFDSAVDKAVVDTLWAARDAVQPMTKVVRPSGGATATVGYDGGTGRVAELTDGNGGVWKPKAPVLGGSTKVYESAVLGGAPTNYWRMAESGVTEAVNQVNGSTAYYNSVQLGSVDGPFGPDHGKAASFNGTGAYMGLPTGLVSAGPSSVSLWFNTTKTRNVLMGTRYNTADPGQYDTPTLWITSDGRLRALSPSSTPTGPLNSMGVAGKCVDVAGSATANGTDIQSYTCNGTAAQNWSLVPTSSDNTTFTVQAFGKCMVAYGNGTTSGTAIKLWDCATAHPAHQWRASSTGALVNVNSGLCLDVPYQAEGTNLQLYTCNQTGPQTWRPALTSKNTVNDGKWHHAVLTTDGYTQTLYVDGVKTQSSTGAKKLTPVAPYHALGLGFVDHSYGNFWDVNSYTNVYTGSLAEAAFYSSVLDEQQVSYQFKARDAVKSAPTGQIEYTVEGPGNHLTTTVNDLMYGRKVADIDALRNATRYGYSGKGHLRTVTDPNGNMTINEYDVRGNVVAVTTCQDRSANLCSTVYSSYYPDATTAQPPASILNDRLTEVRGQGSASATDNTYLTRYTYDGLGNRTSETDALGRKTTITYTDGTTAGSTGGGYGAGIAPKNLPWRVVKPGGGVQTILYHPNGDVAEQQDPSGVVTRYEYDGLGRKTAEIEVVGGQAGPTTRYTHDRLDRVVTVTDPEVTNEVTGSAHRAVTTVEYNADGLITSETVADTSGGDAFRKVGYGYDQFGRRTSQTDAENNVTEFEYDAYGRVTEQTNADGSTVKTTFDPVGNELDTVVKSGRTDGGDLTVRSLAYDPAGRLASETDAMGWVTGYTYTDNNLLRSVIRRNPATGESYVTEQNSYDAAGKKITQVTANGRSKSTATYDAAGRALTATAEVTDTDGATTTTTRRITTTEYSIEDDVVSTTLSDDTSVLGRSEATYDRLGRARQQTTYLSSALTPALRWTMDQTGGSTTTDSTGNNIGAVDGAVSWSTERGGAASFTGGAGSITGQPPVDTMRPYTLSLWARLAATTDDRTVASIGGDIGSPALEIRFDKLSGSWQLAMNTRRADGSTTAPAGTWTSGSAATAWQHLTAVVTPAATPGGTSTAQLYVGGALKGTITTTEQLSNRATDLRISGFSGLVDDVRAYQKALNPGEVGQLAAGAVPAADAKVSRTTFGLTPDGSVTSVTGPNGHTTYIKNDELGRAVRTTTPPITTVKGEGAPTTSVATSLIGYNTFGETTEQQDPDGNVSVNTYDALGRMTEQESPAYDAPGSGPVIRATKTVEYDEVGQVVSTTDPLGATTAYEYDTLGRTSSITAPDGGVTRYEYSDLGDLLSSTDPNGATTASVFDYLGRTLTSTSAVRQTGTGYTTTYSYENGSPWPTTVTSAGGVATRAAYNSAGEPTRITDGAGNVTRMTYDGAGRAVRTTAPDGTYSTVTYDFAGRQTVSAQYTAAGQLLRDQSQVYDVAGLPTKVVDARKTTRTFEYDVLGRLISQREPVNGSHAIATSFGYDASGRQTRFTDGRGNNFITTYNAWGLPESQIEPATAANPADRTFTMSYDAAGRMIRADSPGGVSVTSEYDVMGRLTRTSGAGAQVATVDRTWTYDKVGRMESFTGSAGTNTIGYDDRGLVTSVTGVSGNSSYTYNSDGALASRTDAAGTTSYGYDTAGRPRKVENAAAGVNMTYSYDTMSRVTAINYPGTVRTLGYNGLQQLTSDELKTSAGTTVGRIAYEWNLNDSLTKKTTTGFSGASTNTYTYDLADRLISWDNGTTPTLYAYDDSGNRVQAGTQSFVYDARNQLVSDSSGATYQYSARGTLVSTVTGGRTVDTVTDAFNQVVRQGSRGGGSSSYTYDGLGRMIQPDVTYTGLGNDVAADGSTAYVRDVAGSLVAVASGATKRYAWTDTHTDVVGEFTDSGATLAGSVSYDPWGKVLARAGMVGKLGYQQEWTDQTTGRVNMWSRWYDPETGAFDTRDTANNSPSPASGAANRFAYAEGDPMSNTDTTGNAVDGKCGEYDYACEVKKYQAALSLFAAAMEQRDRDMLAIGTEIAMQEAEFLRAERESQTSLFDILVQVGVGMLLDVIGYTALEGCLGGSLWDCADLASNALGPLKALKMGRSLIRAAENAFDGYRMWKRIIDGAQSALRRASDAINTGRKMLADVMKKVPKKPKPPKKKKKPAAKPKPKPKPKPEPKPQPSKQAKPQKPKTEPKKQAAEKKPDKEAKPAKASPVNKQSKPEKTKPEEKRPISSEDIAGEAAEFCEGEETHSFAPDTRVLMADGSTRPISEINVGDQVQAKDPVTGESGARQVTLLHLNRDLELTDVTVSDRPAADSDRTVNEGKGDRSTRGPTESSLLETTAHHPFWDATTGTWVNAADLIPGESTLVGPDGQLQYVTAVRNHTGAKVMHDLTVANIHTYYVIAGDEPVLVHNVGGPNFVNVVGGDSCPKVGASIRDINPSGGMQNCVRCSIETDKLLSGQSASEVPDGGPFSIAEITNYSGRPLLERKLDEIVKRMQDFGEGSRGIVVGLRGPGETGHAFNVVNQGGVIRFLDGQAGGVADLEDGYKSFLVTFTQKGRGD
ncbi:ricin-type beta-trefoil lectin domain protein [Actinoplanes sp. NPDC026670]|uniref:ricin-type beta-trefoil lectin domain protein n=1 Tax=Actinoplanes sp. NPDC026670 TaxID=3154700 RepID=UPI0033F7D266